MSKGRTNALPIDDVLPAILRSFGDNRAVVLRAPPGAGKTTGVPPAIDEAGWLDAGQLWILQPRRLAARMVAARIAATRGETVGQSVGYHVRHDRRESAATRIVSMTTGMFLRRLQSDPVLENVAAVVLDEFHERTLELDLALALTTRLRRELRDDLRLVVMSATMDPFAIQQFFDANAIAADALSCDGRSFPVAIRYQPHPSRRLSDGLTPIVEEAFHQTEGHVLVFLPGVGEIHFLSTSLRQTGLEQHADIVPLHGSLSPAQQDAATRPGGRRRIILATNIAETSVTIDGVLAVVDSGLARNPIVDPRLGLTRLDIGPISLASADQRAGRAGRTAPGICVRAWQEAMNRSRKPYDAPEIETGDFASAMLLLAAMDETDPRSLPWLTPPPPESIAAAGRLLRRLSAINESGRLTEIGRSMASLPLQPRLARFVIAATGQMPAGDIAAAAALLSERDPFMGQSLSLGEKVDRLRTNPRDPSLEPVRRIARQIEQQVQAAPVQRPVSKNKSAERSTALTRSLLAAFPDRVAIRRPDDPDRGLMVGSRGVVGLKSISDTLPGETTPTNLVLCIEIDGGGTESRVRQADPICKTWLDATLLQTSIAAEFDKAAGAIRCRKTEAFDDLVLKQSPVACVADESTSRLLYENAVANLASVLPETKTGDDAWRTLCERVNRVAELEARRADITDPVEPWDDQLLRAVLKELCNGRTSFESLRRAPWLDHLRNHLTYSQWQRVDRDCPTSIRLPSGNEVAIRYEPGKTPWLAARITQCFGWHETPRILGRRVALQCHLLGPNDRPQQITEDLASFWKNTYPTIRAELKRRYPKHHWPEDPKTAISTPNGLKPRG